MSHENTYISLASHAIGMDYKKPYTRHGKKFYKPYRNYFSTAPGCDTFKAWETMELAGYAKSQQTERGGYIFWLTRAGLDWLGERLGIHIYDEE
ncbi:MAG: hypothetical protein ACOX60_06230 [Massiliimalia sp.]|jgi:hypothetical protein